MKLVDANVLLYAVDVNAAKHKVAKTWLDNALSSRETVLLPWLSLLAFVRLVTHPRVFDRPLSPDQALDVVNTWLSAPNVVTPESDARHVGRLRELLAQAGGHGGNLVNDVHLAALAIQYGAAVMSFDSDFARFEAVERESPPKA